MPNVDGMTFMHWLGSLQRVNCLFSISGYKVRLIAARVSILALSLLIPSCFAEEPANTRIFRGLGQQHSPCELDLWCIHPQRCAHCAAHRRGAFQALSSADLYNSRNLREDRILRNPRSGPGNPTGLGRWGVRFREARWLAPGWEHHSELLDVGRRCCARIRAPS